MAYHIKGFNDWKSQRVDEGLSDIFKNVSKKLAQLISKIPGLGWINGKFEGTGSWFLNKYMQQKKGELPKGIHFYAGKQSKQLVDAALGEKGQNPSAKEFDTTKEMKEGESLTEARAPLTHPDINMVNMTHADLLKQIKMRVIALRENFSRETQFPPLLLWGAVGIGKTAAVEQIADQYQMDVETMSLATIDPDLLLLPEKDPRTGKQGAIPHGDLPVYNSKSPIAAELEAEENGVNEDGTIRGGILFLDEITRAQSTRVTNSMLGLVHNRKIFNWKMASHWIVVGAANREEDDYEGYTRNAAFFNRFLHANLVPTAEDLGRFGKTFIDPDTDKLIMDPAMEEFLIFNRDLLHQFDNTDQHLVVFPTPRTWTMGSQNLVATKKAYDHMPDEKFTERDAEQAVAMAVGIQAARQYFGFLELIKKINPKDVTLVWSNPSKAPLPLKGEGGLKYSPHQASAWITAVLMDKRGEKLSNEQISNYVDYLVKLDDPTWAVIAMQRFLAEHPYVNMADKGPNGKSAEASRFDPKYEDAWDDIMDRFGSKYKAFDPNYTED